MTHEPLTVTAHLEAGVAHAAPWGISLDGLLASVLHSRAKAALEDSGGIHIPVLERVDVVDLPLPLARCTPAADEHLWHWAATCAWPSHCDEEALEVRTWHSFPDHELLEELVDTLPRHVDDDRGRWRRYAMPLLVTLTTSLTWRAVGDIAAIRDLLDEVHAIGKKRAHGEGAVRSWHVEPAPSLDHWSAGHLHPDGALGRATPAACLHDRDIPDGGVGRTGLRPPYLHPARQTRLHRPAPWHTST